MFTLSNRPEKPRHCLKWTHCFLFMYRCLKENGSINRSASVIKHFNLICSYWHRPEKPRLCLMWTRCSLFMYRWLLLTDIHFRSSYPGLKPNMSSGPICLKESGQKRHATPRVSERSPRPRLTGSTWPRSKKLGQEGKRLCDPSRWGKWHWKGGRKSLA